MMRSGRARVGRARFRGVDGPPAPWWWLGLPIVPVQGYRLARTLPRFADADGVTGRVGSGDRRMKVVALGDSVTAGYAIEHHRSSVAGQLAARLADRYGATVDWQACARTGATAGQAVGLVSADALGDADLVFVSIGVNDLKNLHTTARFRRELGMLLDAILAARHGPWCASSASRRSTTSPRSPAAGRRPRLAGKWSSGGMPRRHTRARGAAARIASRSIPSRAGTGPWCGGS